MDVIKELTEVGNTIKQCDDYRTELLIKRADLVATARSEGHTWRELAAVLGMTEHGLIKAAKIGT
jgi:hypothetical protein